MVYMRLPTWKTGMNPSVLHTFDQTGNFTPMQKLMLTRNRIWGNVVGGNIRSGYKEVSTPLKGRYYGVRYEFSRLDHLQPFIHNWDKRNLLKDKYQNRKLRIFMRGMKIGKQKGVGSTMDAMSVFEKSGKKSEAELGQ